MPLSPNMRGAVFIATAMAGFTINDAFVKALTSSMNVGQIMFLRGVLASILILFLAWRYGALRGAGIFRHPVVWLRAAAETAATVTFLIALGQIPLGNATAILQALPLAVTMGAALFLREPVGWRRWSAILVGFAGMLVIVKPGLEGFTVYSLWALGCVVFAAARDLLTKLVPSDVPSLMLSAMTAPAVALAGLAITWPLGGWSPVDSRSLAMLVAAAGFLFVGYQFIILGMRSGEVSFVAPFRYSGIIWAIGLGYVAFGDIPDAWMVTGTLIVVGSGLYMLYREQVRKRDA